MKVFMLRKNNQPDEVSFNRLKTNLEEIRIVPKILDPDSPEGVDFISLYDVVDFPAVLITKDDGGLIQRWQAQLPSAAEISHFYHQ